MSYRQRISLDGIWFFKLDPQGEIQYKNLENIAGAKIKVPAPWQSQAPELRETTGIAWYWRTFSIPKSDNNHSQTNSYVLHFGAVDYRADIWVNGVHIFDHEGGYMPFDIDIDTIVHAGENFLAVRVEDNLELFPEIPHGKQSWYGALSGIWQSVWLEIRPPAYIRNVHLSSGQGNLSVTTSLSRALLPGEFLNFSIVDPDENVVKESRSTQNKIDIQVSNPTFWDPDNPYLYKLRVVWECNQPDCIEIPFGFRSIQTRNGQILLNDRPIFLRGALDQDYYPETGCTPPSLEYIEQQILKAKAMGLNCLRVHIKVADPRYYDAADRLGILIWTELPNWQVFTNSSAERARQTLRMIVDRDHHHPSIIIWTIINESWGLDLTQPDQRAWLADSYDYLKKLDPSRLIVDNSACWGNHHVVTDLEDFHNYYAMPDHASQWSNWVQKLASRPSWTFARPYNGFDEWRMFLKDPWNTAPYAHAPEVYRRGDEPLLVSEFGNWGLPDIDKFIDSNGNEPWWFETGSEWGGGIVYPHGIQHRFHIFQLQREFNSLIDFMHATQWTQYNALKYQIEQMRRYGSLAGYVITEFTDVHWECNGLLDLNRNPKIFFDKLSDLNNADLIIPGWERLAFWAGEELNLPCVFSHYSHRDLTRAKIEWQMVPSDNSKAFEPMHGGFNFLVDEQYGISMAGIVRIKMPDVPKPIQVALDLWVRDDQDMRVSHNPIKLKVFPRPVKNSAENPHLRVYAPETFHKSLESFGCCTASTLEDSEVCVANILDDNMRQYITKGGRVLWLAENANAQKTFLGNMRLQDRLGTYWQGDWVSNYSWLYCDQLFPGMPGGGMVDFTFAGLTPDTVITGLNRYEYAHNVHAALTVGWLHQTAALIARRKVGKGDLLTCTFKIGQSIGKHPIAAWMFNALLQSLLY